MEQGQVVAALKRCATQNPDFFRSLKRCATQNPDFFRSLRSRTTRPREARSFEFIEHMRLGQAFQSSSRRAVTRVGGDSVLFPSRQLLEIGAAAAEAEFAVEPEGAGIEGFVVVLSDLVGINRDGRRAGEGAERTQSLSVDPGGFALAIGVEADLDPFAQSDGFDVVDGDAVLERESGDVGAQREAARRRKIPKMHDDAAASISRAKITRAKIDADD